MGEALLCGKHGNGNPLQMWHVNVRIIYQSMGEFSSPMLHYQRVQLDSFWFGWFLGMFDRPLFCFVYAFLACLQCIASFLTRERLIGIMGPSPDPAVTTTEAGCYHDGLACPKDIPLFLQRTTFVYLTKALNIHLFSL